MVVLKVSRGFHQHRLFKLSKIMHKLSLFGNRMSLKRTLASISKMTHKQVQYIPMTPQCKLVLFSSF